MSSLNELINNKTNAALSEELTERLAIVEHKIKFIERVPVCFLDTQGEPNLRLAELAALAGAAVTTQPMEAAFVVFAEETKGLDDLMKSVLSLLDAEWPAVKFNRVCILADNYNLTDAADMVTFVEDVAEMLHPGFFVFGAEGEKWIRFTI